MVTVFLPARRNPVKPLARSLPATGHPHIVGTAPSPIATNPKVSGGRGESGKLIRCGRWCDDDTRTLIVIGVIHRIGSAAAKHYSQS
jgi:hypothetical protein